jgi:methylated-DNA-[protein]-cysteine S-methyltransferase
VTRYNELQTEIGPLTTMVDESGVVVGVRFGKAEARADRVLDPEATKDVDKQLLQYFAKEREEFDLPLNPKGSDFQQQVWQAIAQIPYGQTRTYGQIARQLGDPHASQAVGQAAGANPIPIIIPCHRVIGASSALVGFGGGLATKEKLLHLERGIPASLFDF